MKISLLPRLFPPALSALLLALAPVFPAANAASAAPTAAAPTPPAGAEVVWTTPSKNTYETMPLGNGEVALNAWVDELGDLRFYISRIDSVDENFRVLKVGAVRVRVGDAAVKRTAAAFRQTLDTHRGVLTTEYGTGDERVSLRLWVDANRPVIVVETETAKPAAASATNEMWRVQREKITDNQSSEVAPLPSNARDDGGGKRHTETIPPIAFYMEPDTVLVGVEEAAASATAAAAAAPRFTTPLVTGARPAIGWFHRNAYSSAYHLVAKIQGMENYPREDPILHRTFGALIQSAQPARRANATTLEAAPALRHRFEIAAITLHPATPQKWLDATAAALRDAAKIPVAERFANHQKWWLDFANRSWVRFSKTDAAAIANGTTASAAAALDPIPSNNHNIRIGYDQHNTSAFQGDIARLTIFKGVRSDADIAKYAQVTHDAPSAIFTDSSVSFHANAQTKKPLQLPNTSRKTFAGGITIEAAIFPKSFRTHGRIADKITPGRQNGFLFDTTPGGGLRVVIGDTTHLFPRALTQSRWQHVAVTIAPDAQVRVFLAGKPLTAAAVTVHGETDTNTDDAFVLTRAYALQRYITACAGRGRLPIKFNGSIFTVPEKGKEGNADYRRWGPGYWWQNTRLPYLSMHAAGDFDLIQPLFRMYIDDLLPLCLHRTKKYLAHGGAYYPECIFFWGDVFPKTYGWTPWDKRKDKLQSSGWHKWEWVGGLELAQMALEYAAYTGDTAFLRDKAIPLATEILRFFDEHYKTAADGKLHMWPSQALETWWDCVNPMPEVAGLHAVTAQLETATAATPALRPAFLTALKNKLPPIPVTQSRDGKTMLAPGKVFKSYRNCENPELYAVFPFRLVTYANGNTAHGIEALNNRRERGAFGWRQDDLFMANLGLGDQARSFLVRRARNKHAASRFPAFWGPNYDWIPDQDHGGVLTKGAQSLAMQCEGTRIDLFPAWPTGWDGDFKLHAPFQTTVEATLKNGKITKLIVTPKEREKDVRVLLKK
ncbi:MAG: DUF5703 domain-containing protein [Puniceicoccales bacterium]|jgi:hypothetical protein|nr:DUF5703 domain-containing protein [Puniceicoccales bacterium]